MTYKATYLQLVKEIRATGWSVRHIKMASAYGQIYVHNYLIEINSQISWKEKLGSLCHEYSHSVQWTEKKWRRFFVDGRLPDTPANRIYVVEAEVDASRRAKKMCEDLGFPNVYFGELDPIELERLKPLWYKDYLTPDKKQRKRCIRRQP